MARPREFCRDEALDKAVEVFWTYGFEATSMTDLRKAMGIGRQSLYATFGDKDQLFAEVLRHYMRGSRDRLERLLDGRGLDGIRELLMGSAAGMTEAEVRRGCLIMNTCVERAAHDATSAAATRQGLDDTRAALQGALRRAVERREVSPEIDVSSAAAFLTNQLAGMAVLGKAGASRAELEDIVNTALSALALPG